MGENMIEFTIQGVPVKHVETRQARGRWYSPSHHDKINLKTEMYQFRPFVPSEKAIILQGRYIMPIPKSVTKKLRDEMIRCEIEGQPMPHKKKPDTCSMNKILKDAMEGIFFKNDSQVFDEHFKKFYGQNPRTYVIVKDYC